MKTVTIQIGNSDDKLTQKKWAEFIGEISVCISFANECHFFGTSSGEKVWQNACWVIEIVDWDYDRLKKLISDVREKYNQDSIAWTVGETEFI